MDIGAVTHHRSNSAHVQGRSDGKEVVHRIQRSSIRYERWSDQDFQVAILGVDNGSRISSAARVANILVTPIRDHLFGQTIGKKQGP
jgi:hypothetical protein